jgi:hypothetical protein
MNLIEGGCNGVDWIGLTQDRGNWRAAVNAVMNFHVLRNAEKFFEWLHNWWAVE